MTRLNFAVNIIEAWSNELLQESVMELGHEKKGMMTVIQNISENYQETSRRTVVCVGIELSLMMGEENQELRAKCSRDFMGGTFKSISAL
jgi:hypothetical protein